MINNSLFISAKEVQILHGWSRTWAFEHIKTIRAALGKNKNQKLTKREYCDYEGISLAEMENFINENTTVSKIQ